jgi:hypothetical protein
MKRPQFWEDKSSPSSDLNSKPKKKPAAAYLAYSSTL